MGLGSALSPDELGQLANFQMVGWANLDDLPQLAPLYTELGHVPMLVKHLRQLGLGSAPLGWPCGLHASHAARWEHS